MRRVGSDRVARVGPRVGRLGVGAAGGREYGNSDGDRDGNNISDRVGRNDDEDDDDGEHDDGVDDVGDDDDEPTMLMRVQLMMIMLARWR